MDFAPYQSSPPEHGRVASPLTSPRASVDAGNPNRRPFSPSALFAATRSPPPLQHPQPQRAWHTAAGDDDLDDQGNHGGGVLSGFGAGWGNIANWGLRGGGGSPAMPGAYPVEVSEFDTSLGLRLDYEACLAYLAFPPVGAMILLILEKNSDYVRFHAWQSALLFTALMVFHLFISWSSFLSWIFFFADLALIAFLTLKAYQDAEDLERFEVPFIGGIATRILDDE